MRRRESSTSNWTAAWRRQRAMSAALPARFGDNVIARKATRRAPERAAIDQRRRNEPALLPTRAAFLARASTSCLSRRTDAKGARLDLTLREHLAGTTPDANRTQANLLAIGPTP